MEQLSIVEVKNGLVYIDGEILRGVTEFNLKSSADGGNAELEVKLIVNLKSRCSVDEFNCPKGLYL